MDANKIIDRWGLAGIFALSFLSATLLPGVSEIGLAALVVSRRFKAWQLILWATLGNWLGSVFTFGTGYILGGERLTEWFDIEADDIADAQSWVAKYGAWAGLFVWVPVIGDPIAACLGLIQAPVVLTCFAMLVGKFVRYSVIVLAAAGGLNLFRRAKNNNNKDSKNNIE